MMLLNPFARVAICGLIADYKHRPRTDAEERHRAYAMFLVARFKRQGIHISETLEPVDGRVDALGGLLARGN